MSETVTSGRTRVPAIGDSENCSECHGPCEDSCQHVELRMSRRRHGMSAMEHTSIYFGESRDV